MNAKYLRNEYPEFIYQSYRYKLVGNDLILWFDFVIRSSSTDENSIKFRPKTILKNVSMTDIKRLGESTLNNLVFHLGLAEMPSYWKATASPNIHIEAGSLNKTQANWWHDLLLRGMGQYFYENKIDFTPYNFLRITSDEKRFVNSAILNKINAKNKRILVPMGGGKDAVVTYEILKNAKQYITPFILNPTSAQKALVKRMEQGKSASSANKTIIVLRTLDPKLIELNHKGYLNGHTPFSAYLAFSAMVCAAVFDYKYIAVSNERSSNEGNAAYLDREINHQYSKTFAFEKKFRTYSKKYLAQNIEYFSFLRPLYELQIGKIFSKHPEYFATFLSCNEAYKTASGKSNPTGTWCGICSKCLFVFTILFPFIETEKLTKIFKKNLFEDENLISIMEELIGERGHKPFECVGTHKESLVAFYLSLQKTHPPLPILLKHFRKNIGKKHSHLISDAKTLLASWDKNHTIPAHLENHLYCMLK